MAIASFTPRRGLGVASVIAFYLLTSAVSTVLFATLESMGNDTAAAWAWLINPFFLVDAAVQVGLFGRRVPRTSSIYPSGAGTAGRASDHARADRPVRDGPDHALPEGGLTMNIELAQVSRWYGNVVAVNDVTMTVGPGVTGLLGPNGAGKSTLLHMMAGFLAPSGGTVTLDGARIWHNHEIYRSIGLVPEREAVYGFLTGWQFVLSSARLHRLPNPDDAARKALALVEMESAKDRRIETYSKGMRQRVKVAAALVHDPQVLLLDEPFNGMDPRQRMHLMDLVRDDGRRGQDHPVQLAHPGGGGAGRPAHRGRWSPAGTPPPATSARSAAG